MTVVGVMACSKSKRGEDDPEATFPARDLYDSWLFDGRVAALEAHCDEWRIFSAKHGCVAPDDELSYYDVALGQLASERRKELAREVAAELPAADAVMLLAGRTYARPLKEALPNDVTVLDPLEGVQLFDQREALQDLADGGFAEGEFR